MDLLVPNNLKGRCRCYSNSKIFWKQENQVHSNCFSKNRWNDFFKYFQVVQDITEAVQDTMEAVPITMKVTSTRFYLFLKCTDY